MSAAASNQMENPNAVQPSVDEQQIQQATAEKKQKPAKKKNAAKPVIVYMEIDDPTYSKYQKLKRVIISVINEWVSYYKMPIRRKKLVELVCADNEISTECMKDKKKFNRLIGSVLDRMEKSGDVIKVKDVVYKKAAYYILPAHLELFKDKIVKKE